ncbi:MAG: 3-methyl-2-oxobutanoate hydroxymethyltransferase [Spirochaetaceae bacterium]|nr:3-methyl-2-oxobutanoate hydroxymethyltransferase [Spirochaetaceae bacterium]RKX77495.1 MAG: 3-methyl-2-oxobutanoate hydroxymethyltransferase [Spirochaetota bacterium]RKX89153.1 MAG: 3-methyl-2-oxobutanoate hydroxymethyltransferase [Spirochaetota bacterium]RKX98388.1 MAG: 3-methyl-2-oxobutanoate hydroxymethyltransferase [Spirochaetota bacterium]
MNINDFISKKRDGIPISMVTSYDSWSAKLIAASDVDCILVGDSVSMVLHGHSTTLPVDTRQMAVHVEAVRRGAPESFIIGDLPFLSFRMGMEKSMENIAVLMRAGANAVKLEGAAGNLELIRHTVDSGVPVMGHLGLTPQSINRLGGFRVQGRGKEAADRILDDAQSLQEAGCFSIVLEAVPGDIAGSITTGLNIPIIGIGAGIDVDGQVLVLQDLLGLTAEFKPKFVRNFLDGASLVKKALNDYHHEVTERSFPGKTEWYE